MSLCKKATAINIATKKCSIFPSLLHSPHSEFQRYQAKIKVNALAASAAIAIFNDSAPGFLEIIICEKIFTEGSVKDERIDYKKLSLIKDLYFTVSVTNDPTSFRVLKQFFWFWLFLLHFFSRYLSIFFFSYRYFRYPKISITRYPRYFHHYHLSISRLWWGGGIMVLSFIDTLFVSKITTFKTTMTPLPPLTTTTNPSPQEKVCCCSRMYRSNFHHPWAPPSPKIRL